MAFGALLSACGPRAVPPLDGSDIRIDRAGENNDPDSTGTKMCTNSRGHVFVVWTDNRDGELDVWMNRSLNWGRDWLPSAVKVSVGNEDGPAGETFGVDIACTGEHVYVVWEDDRDGELKRHNVYFTMSDNGGETWAPDRRLDLGDFEGLHQSIEPKIVARQDYVYVAWMDDTEGAYDIHMQASQDNGATWLRNPYVVDAKEPGSAYSASPQLAINRTGQLVYVVWEDSRDGRSDIYFDRGGFSGDRFAMAFGARLPSGNVRLDTDDDVINEGRGRYHSFEPRIAADEEKIYVVWHDERFSEKAGAGRDIYMNYSADFGSSWLESGAKRVETQGAPNIADSINPHVAMRGQTGHFVWQDAQDGGYDIYYRKAVAGQFINKKNIRLDRDPPGFANSLRPKVSIADNWIAAVWEDGRDDAENAGYNDIYYNYTPTGETAFPPLEDPDLRVDSMEPGQSFKVELNLQVVGEEMFMAWTDGRNGTADVYFKHLKVGDEALYQPSDETVDQ